MVKAETLVMVVDNIILKDLLHIEGLFGHKPEGSDLNRHELMLREKNYGT